MSGRHEGIIAECSRCGNLREVGGPADTCKRCAQFLADMMLRERLRYLKWVAPAPPAVTHTGE